MAPAEHYARARDAYARRAARGGRLAPLWRVCADACERQRKEALLADYRRRRRTPGWVPSVPVREVDPPE